MNSIVLKQMSRMSLELIERFHPMQVLHLPARKKQCGATRDRMENKQAF